MAKAGVDSAAGRGFGTKAIPQAPRSALALRRLRFISPSANTTKESAINRRGKISCGQSAGEAAHRNEPFRSGLVVNSHIDGLSEGGKVLDPFAGEATKGIVAAHLGFQYTGVELRESQVEINRDMAAQIGVSPEWICGDSAALDSLLPPGEMYDFIWTSPPYYDLEIYSESEKDGSAFETYEKFMEWYRAIFEQAVARLSDNRFLGVKIGEVRDKKPARIAISWAITSRAFAISACTITTKRFSSRLWQRRRARGQTVLQFAQAREGASKHSVFLQRRHETNQGGLSR
jgi:16S rRNA G966 N2-methylase RsmD